MNDNNNDGWMDIYLNVAGPGHRGICLYSLAVKNEIYLLKDAAGWITQTTLSVFNPLF